MKKSLEEELMELFPLVHRKLFRPFHKNHFRGQHSRILMTIGKHEGHSMKYYSEKLMISKPNMTKAVAGLIEDGLIKRDHDQGDRRIINLFLTEDGRNEVIKAKREMLNMVKEKLEPLSDDDKRALQEYFKGINSILSKIEG